MGRYILEQLSKRGHEAVSLSRSAYPELMETGVKTIIADVCDFKALKEKFKGIDAVIHVAAKVGIWGRRSDFYETNVTGTQNVIRACFENGVKRLVYTSSPSVIFDGKDHENIDETYPYPSRYLAFYPETKAIAERAVLSVNGQGILTCALRPHLVWGPRDTNLIPRLIERAENGKLRIVGNGENMIDMVYVENVAQAHVLAMEQLSNGGKVSGNAYFISQGKPVNCWQWINGLLEKLGKPQITKQVSYRTAYFAGAMLELIYKVTGKTSEPAMTRFLASQLAKSHYFNISKAKSDFGYEPLIGDEEGINRLIESLKVKDG